MKTINLFLIALIFAACSKDATNDNDTSSNSYIKATVDNKEYFFSGDYFLSGMEVVHI